MGKFIGLKGKDGQDIGCGRLQFQPHGVILANTEKNTARGFVRLHFDAYEASRYGYEFDLLLRKTPKEASRNLIEAVSGSGKALFDVEMEGVVVFKFKGTGTQEAQPMGAVEDVLFAPIDPVAAAKNDKPWWKLRLNENGEEPAGDETNAGAASIGASTIDLDDVEAEELIEQKNAKSGEAKDSGATIGIIVAVVVLTVGAIAVGLFCKSRASEDEKAEKPAKASARQEAYKVESESGEVPAEAVPNQAAAPEDSLDVTVQKSIDVLVGSNPVDATVDGAPLSPPLGKHKVADSPDYKTADALQKI
jgi:hypothetical protein